jgi:ABC-type multidrug transport system fused ATPase/permease subunit
LRAGEIVERGRHQQLLDRGGHYARMHNIQHGTTTPAP